MRNLLKKHAGALQLIFVVGVIGSAVLISASLKPDASEARPQSAPGRVSVSVVSPASTDYTSRVQLNGVVETRTVTSVIPQVGGRVVKVSPSFRPGASVAEGDVLFVIDPTDYELAIDRTLAEIEVARSELARVEAEGSAERKIWKDSFPNRPIPDLIARKPQIAAAKARIHSGEAARAAAEVDLARTVVRAPFDARILETQLDLGQVVGVNVAVGSMFSTASLEIAAPVSSDELRRIGDFAGRPAKISTDTGQLINGIVTRKAASLDQRTRLGTLFIATENPEALTLGEFATIEIEGTEISNAYRLPPGALTSRDRLWVVENEQLVQRRVEVLGREGDVVIVDAFDIADGIVAIPPADVRAGLPVDPVFNAEFASNGGFDGASR